MANEINVSNIPASIDRLSAEDFETASIRSAAPSYTSEAPSYHSTFPGSEPIPTYAPPAPAPSTTSAAADVEANPTSASADPGTAPPHARQNSLPTLLPSSAATEPTIGLPPAPRRASDPPPGVLRIAPWSQLSANPTAARHYQSVARRRVAAASTSGSGWGSPARSTLERVAEEDAKVRPLEDPYLVGEEAAKRAREERLAKENGDDVLYREDRRWDWFLAQMQDWDERERSWNQFRQSLETKSRGKLARRIRAFR